MNYSAKIRRRRKGQRRGTAARGGLVNLEPDALYWQEMHSPTEAVEVRISAERKKTQTRRRKLDARLFDSLSSHQQQAMENIDAGFRYLTAGGGISRMRFEMRFDGAGPGAAGGLAGGGRPDWLERAYMDWHQASQLAGGINGAAVLDIAVFGRGLGEVDKLRKKRKGWAKENLIEGLRLYCKLQGWPEA